MSVEYKENESGYYWVDGDKQGEPQKDLRHAMDDDQLTVSGRKDQDAGERVHTGDDGGPTDGVAGSIADNAGSAGESQDPELQGSEGETKRSGAGRGGKNDPNPATGSSGSAG